jgi:hypothetical protein
MYAGVVVCLCGLYLLVIDQHNGLMLPKFIFIVPSLPVTAKMCRVLQLIFILHQTSFGSYTVGGDKGSV